MGNERKLKKEIYKGIEDSLDPKEKIVWNAITSYKPWISRKDARLINQVYSDDFTEGIEKIKANIEKIKQLYK